MTSPILFSGNRAVLYAWFREDDVLDLTAMARQVEYCVENEWSGITVLGLATEVQKLTFSEREILIAEVGQAIKGRLPYSVTITGNSVAEQPALARFAKDNGADWLILPPPMVGNYSADVYLDFFEPERLTGDGSGLSLYKCE